MDFLHIHNKCDTACTCPKVLNQSRAYVSVEVLGVLHEALVECGVEGEGVGKDILAEEFIARYGLARLESDFGQNLIRVHLIRWPDHQLHVHVELF